MKPTLVFILVLLSLAGCQSKQEQQVWTTVMEAEIYKISALSGGQIKQILVSEGQEIESGTLVAKLDDQQFRFNREQLQASLLELEAQNDLYQSQIALAAADLEYQSSRQQRNEKLYEEEMIARQQFEDGEIIKKKAELQHESARKNLALVKAKQASLQAQLKSVQKQIDDCVIVSSFSGRVESVFYDEGEMLPAMAHLAEIVNTKSMEANIYVNEERLATLKPGMRVKLRVNGYKNELTAQITRISNKAEFTPKTVLTPDNRTVMVYAVRLRTGNTQGILKDGMPVDVYLP
ncbi:MAG TPA: HlyD family efflux transporter periplasmic adaptor subunit [Candidatus Cloacimonadota bacterium]|nr:HlyD family efflux transporter periplasmic adaptor subunit [Candidatus Cloacimonadota bacterium]